MTPDEVLALLQVIARQQVQVAQLESALREAHQRLAATEQPTPPAA